MGPKNFYNAVDQRKLGTDKIDAIQNELDSMISLPPVTSEDEGKTVVVSDQGEWEVGNINLGTIKNFTGDSDTTSVTIEDDSITAESMIDIYTSIFGYNPTNIVAGDGYVTLSFAGGVNFSGKVVIR